MIVSETDIQLIKYRKDKKWIIFSVLIILNTLFFIFISIIGERESYSYEIPNTLFLSVIAAIGVSAGSYIATSRLKPKDQKWKEIIDLIAKIILAEALGIAIVYILILPVMGFLTLLLLASSPPHL
jgi:hypothetical protein